MSTKIRLILKDGVVLEKKKDTLIKRFGLVENIITEFPNLESLETLLTLEDWNLVWSFVSFLEVPTTKPSWIDLIKTADYLLLNSLYSGILREYALKYLSQEKIFWVNPITLEDIAKKIANPQYRTSNEEQCQHIFWHGEASAPRCPNRVEPGYKYCLRCFERH